MSVNLIYLSDTPWLYNLIMEETPMKSEPAQLFPISIVGVAAKSVVNKHSKHLKRTKPSAMEIECTAAGIEAVLKDAQARVNQLTSVAVSKRRMGEIDEAELREFAAAQFAAFIAEIRTIL